MEPWRRVAIVGSIASVLVCLLLSPRTRGGNAVLNLFMTPYDATSVGMGFVFAIPVLLAVALFTYSTRPKP
jgi:hypothetical protein